VVLSHDTSGCSCIFVALPPPSDAVPACWCVSTPVMRVAVCLLYVSTVKHRRAAVQHVSLFVLLLLLCAKRLFAHAWYRCVSRCDSRERRSVTASSSGMTALGTCGLSDCVVWGHSHTVLLFSDSMQCADWLSFDLI
jgi:hypothetical protein